MDVVHDRPASRPAVAITFDDGYADNFECAFPWLKQYGLSATFFLTAGFVERHPAVVGRMGDLLGGRRVDNRPLAWAQVREMRRWGMDIGAHTYSHVNLARLEGTAAEVELGRSKEILEQRLGECVGLLAYPFGVPGQHYTARTRALALTLGYEYAAAVMFRAVRSADSRFAIPRFVVAQDSVDVLREKVLGSWDLIGWCQEAVKARWAALTGGYPNLRPVGVCLEGQPSCDQ